MKITWVDHKREPVCPSNPSYPKGMDVDVSGGARKTCTTDVPYPAERCGLYILQCEACGLTTAITTAGRADDPRTVKVACRELPEKLAHKNQPRLQ